MRHILFKELNRKTFKEDARLLKVAIEQVPRLPCDDVDLLIVKEMGKMYSGTGVDTKVIGRR